MRRTARLFDGLALAVAFWACDGLTTMEPQTPPMVPGPAAPKPVTPPDLELPMRAVHINSVLGTNRTVMIDWEQHGTGNILPPDYVEWLKSLHVNWIGITALLPLEDNTDSTVEWSPDYLGVDHDTVSDRPLTFSDRALRQLIREFRSHEMDVYLTLAFGVEQRFLIGFPLVPDGVPADRWPWSPDHPEHESFIAEFWETYTQVAVDIAKLAQEEGVRLYSLGTETDNLFRTRAGRSDTWPNHYGAELKEMVRQVRAEFDGLLTYDMHYSAIVDRDYYQSSDHLWADLGFDVIGVSAYFPLTDMLPSVAMSVEDLEAGYDRIFRDHLVPLRDRNPGRPIVFTEYGAPDEVGAPFMPDAAGFDQFVFSDPNGNGVDDGREVQANIFQALFSAASRYPGVLGGAFFWDNWIASDQLWQSDFANTRCFSIRDKPSGEVVRSWYEATRRRVDTSRGS